jgi:Rha family phage regulatory protein
MKSLDEAVMVLELDSKYAKLRNPRALANLEKAIQGALRRPTKLTVSLCGDPQATPEDWAAVRAKWENDPDYSFTDAGLELGYSRQNVHHRAKEEGWKKRLEEDAHGEPQAQAEDPKDLVALVGGVPKTTSLVVAEKFGKRHDNVLAAIEGLECSPEFRLLNFKESSYLNSQNKPQPMVEMTRDGFTFLAMGFTGKEAARWKEKYIAAFNAMEAELRGQAEPTGQKATPDPSAPKLNVIAMTGTFKASFEVLNSIIGLPRSQAILGAD